MSASPISSPALILGTAMWGWTVPEARCFALLDDFYAAGGRKIDGATNYPINKNADDFRKAEQILANWCRSNAVNDLEVIMKVGSLNNLMTPDQNLSPSFLLICKEEYHNLLGDNLACLMVHWDNRSEKTAIKASLETLRSFAQYGIKVGLSGIRYPAVYAEVLREMELVEIPVEFKHNLLYSDYERYAPLRPYAKFLAYGVNAGGLKLSSDAYRQEASLIARGGAPQKHQNFIHSLQKLLREFAEENRDLELPQQMNQLGMLYAAYHPGVEGILLGPSKVGQLQSSRKWLQRLRDQDYSSLYLALSKLSV